jgi:hypothetical protein
MLSANSPELEFYEQAFTDMDARYQLFGRFMDNYARPDRTSCVYAEIQVLEHFYAHNLHFACDNPFKGKPVSLNTVQRVLLRVRGSPTSST